MYQNAAKELNNSVTHEELDLIGLHITRDNGRLIRAMFGELAYKELMVNPFEKIDFSEKILVSAGVKVKQTTDTTAVQFAQTYGITKLVNLSNISYVYDKDPNQYEDAKKLETLNWQELQELVGTEQKPGMNVPFDPVATKLAASLNLEVAFLEGTNIANLKKYLSGEDFQGSVVK